MHAFLINVIDNNYYNFFFILAIAKDMNELKNAPSLRLVLANILTVFSCLLQNKIVFNLKK